MTQLGAADGTCYALAQGPLSTGNADNATAGRLRDTACGRVPSGALVLKDMSSEVAQNGRITLVLKDADYATAERLKDLVVAQGTVARVLGPATVEVVVDQGSETALLARIGEQELKTDVPAVVVFNEKTGTIVMGGGVSLSPVAVSHGSLKVHVADVPVVQTSGFGQRPHGASMSVVGGAASGPATLQDLVDALNDLGATPAEMMQVLQALKQAGALKARLEIQ